MAWRSRRRSTRKRRATAARWRRWAARARIRELEEHPDWARGSRQPRDGSASTNEIIALSRRYGVISRATSFVAVERRDTPVEGDVQLRRVPIRLADGWGGLPSVARDVFPAASAGFAVPTKLMGFEAGAPKQQYTGEPDLTYETFNSFGPPAHKFRGMGAMAPDFLRRRYIHLILSLQRTNGTWELTNALAHHVVIHIRQLEDARRASPLPQADANVAWATAIAIAWCQRYAPHMEREWGAAVRKARTKLEQLVKDEADSWIAAALALYAVVHVKWNEGLKELL